MIFDVNKTTFLQEFNIFYEKNIIFKWCFNFKNTVKHMLKVRAVNTSNNDI